jgi:tripartite-type tricarboxylate transporter receptor subunit TctC
MLMLGRRRGWLATIVIAAAAWGAVGPAHAQSCSMLAGRTITWIVPLSPGGGFDIEARVLAPHLAKAMGADVVVQNMPGAGGQIGAKAIRDATPDGTAFGVVNGSGLIAVALLDEPGAPRLEEFTILGRSGPQRHVWMVSEESPILTADEMIARAQAGDLVFGATDLGGASFLSTVLGASLLGFEPELVVGYRGSAEIRVAALRGDIDAMSGTFESSYGMLATGELRPLLQLSSVTIGDDPVLTGVPTLGGPDGLAVRHAAATGGDVAEAEALAGLAAEVTGLGRFLVAPLGLSPDVEECLAGALARVMADPATLADIRAANRDLEPLDAAEATAVARDTLERAGVFRPLVEQAIARVRS